MHACDIAEVCGQKLLSLALMIFVTKSMHQASAPFCSVVQSSLLWSNI